MSILQLPNVNVPMVDPRTGKITREWLLPLQGFITTVTASDITTLTDAVDALNAAILALQTANTTLQASIDNLQAEITVLESSTEDAASLPDAMIVQRVSDLEGKVKDLDQGYQA